MAYRITENDREVIVTGELAVTVPPGVLGERAAIMYFDYRYRIPLEGVEPADEEEFVKQRVEQLSSDDYKGYVANAKAYAYRATRIEPVG